MVELWYELGRLYSGVGPEGRRASARGFVTACLVAALVLLSAPLFGTAWAGPFAPLIPVAAGLLVGAGSFGWRKLRFHRRRAALGRALEAAGEDASRPTAEGLGLYYDAQLILLRCEYEYLRRGTTLRAARSARLFEEVFGFTPEDAFECGPLNVAPDTERMRELRERWERRLASRRAHGMEPPASGLREDRAYRVFPREMTVPAELATRRAYLTISNELLKLRHGRRPLARGDMPEDIRRRAERDLREHMVLTRKLRP